MDARQQHFIPRFLLKGFSSHVNKKNSSFTWIYQKNGKIYNTNIKNICVERDFYGNKKYQEFYADGIITNAEYKYAHLIENLRLKNQSQKINDSDILDLVSHLLIRNKFLREEAPISGNHALSRIKDYFANKNFLKQSLIGYCESHPNEIINYFDKKFKEKIGRSMTFNERLSFLSKIKDNVLNPSQEIADLSLALTQAHVIKKIENRQRELPELSKDAHNMYIYEQISKSQPIELIQDFNWFIIVDKQPSYILGDTAVICQKSKKHKKQYLPFPKKETEEVILPISNYQLIIGSKRDLLPKIDRSIINNNIAKCSQNCFMSSYQNSILKNYIGIIGKNSKLYEEQEIENYILNAFTELFGNRV